MLTLVKFMACFIRFPVFRRYCVCMGKIVTGPMSGLEEKNAYLDGLLDLNVFVTYLMDKMNILCDNQQVWMLITY